MKYSLVLPLFVLSSVNAFAHYDDFCQAYFDGRRTYDNLILLAKMTPEMDWDEDGLTNAEEVNLGTNPCIADAIPREKI